MGKKQTKIKAKLQHVIRRIEQEDEGIPKEPQNQSRERQRNQRSQSNDERLENDERQRPIEATGDKLEDKEEGIIRLALQNPNGIKLHRHSILDETIAIQRLQIDIAAFPECNLSNNGKTREELERQLSGQGESVRIVQASARGEHTTREYQPGGVLTAFTGRITGRVLESHRDPWGRYSWTKLRGDRREGVCVITAYRVCQVQQMLIEERTRCRELQDQNDTIPANNRSKLNPRKRILQDLEREITKIREAGFHVILMMDANDDWTKADGKELKSFIDKTQLKDPLYEKHHDQNITPTYARGTKRIDYILMDEVLLGSVRRIGALGLHEAMISDHVMVFVDIDEKEALEGKLNRPVRIPSREFILAQSDKCQSFLEAFKEQAEIHQFKRRIESLRSRLTAAGSTPALVREYNNIDKQIQDAILSAAKRTIKKKYGYCRSLNLGKAGMGVSFWKSVHSARNLHMEVPDGTKNMAGELQLAMEEVEQLTKQQIRTKIREAVSDLRDIQYKAYEEREEWVAENYRDIARARQELDWESNMKKMLREAKERTVNKKLTGLTKGSRRSLDWIEIPIGQWFYSHTNKEIYKYDRGVFECYAAITPSPSLIPDSPWKFYTHHHLKVPHEDIVQAEVIVENEQIVMTAVSLPSVIWHTVNDTNEIEMVLLERNSRHLKQAEMEEGKCHDPTVRAMMADHGLDLMDEILQGTIEIPEATDDIIVAWIKAHKQTETEMTLPSITGEISKEEFQKAFRVVSEHTSSSPSGIHYTLWKCLARDDTTAGYMATMMSLPFIHGFVNDRWTRVIDVMLEKKQGNRKIHMLRIIALLEADFNTALKILFSQRLITNAEKAGLNNEQWGSRKNRMSLDPAMRNMITFEYGRYKRATIAMFAADLTACFDRMFPSLSNIAAGKFGMDANVLRARGSIIQNMRRAVRTGHGVSDDTYGNAQGEPEIAGELQGKGDVAILYCLQSSIALNTHAKLFPELCLTSPNRSRAIRKRHDGYVDDVNTWAGTTDHDLGVEDNTMYDLQQRSQGLTDLNEVGGGSTAFHKCACQFMSWISNGVTLEINYTPDTRPLILVDAKGAPSKIKMLAQNGTNKGLGYYMAADGNQKMEFAQRSAQITKMCAVAATSRLSYTEAKQLLEQRLIPQMRYGLTLSQFTQEQCQELTVSINKAFLPKMRVNRHMKRAVVWGPKEWGGMGLNTDVYCLQAQCALTYMIRALRWDKVVAEDILTTIDQLQMLAGFETPVLEGVTLKIAHKETGWLLNLREMMKKYDMSLWVENTWQPQRHRLYDRSIMEEFATTENLRPKERLLAAEFRLWLRVTMISELANEIGTEIDYHRIENDSEWRARSNLDWPNHIEPRDEHRAAFRKGLRETFCTEMSSHSGRANFKLDQPLGRWYPLKRDIEYDAYRDKETVYYRDEIGLHKGIPQGNYQYRIPLETIPEPPLKSHPIPVNMTSQDIFWTKRPRRLSSRPQPRQEKTVIMDTLPCDTTDIDIISDAAVHVSLGKGAACWRAVDNEERLYSQRFPLEVEKDSYSYRQELIGLYHGLKTSLRKFPSLHSVNCYCDNKAGIDKVKQPTYGPGEVSGPDMDVILAIRELVKTQEDVDIAFHHVQGHADEKKKEEDITRLERHNIECDKGAEQSADDTPIPFHPLKGSKCMLKVSGKWITTRVDKAIQHIKGETELKTYLMKKLRLQPDALNDIDTEALKSARSVHTWSRTVRTSKMMTKWLPVGKNFLHHGGHNSLCPGCGVEGETFEHLFRCRHTHLKDLRLEARRKILRILRHEKIHWKILQIIDMILRRVMLYNMPEELPKWQDNIQRLWDKQKKIGRANFIKGWISKEWAITLKSLGEKDPGGQTAKIITTMWEVLCEPLWETRNNILAQTENPTVLLETRTLREKVQWYKRFSRQVLAQRHQHLTDFTEEDIAEWDKVRCRKEIRTLDAAKEIYEIECTQRMRGQRVITDWFAPRRRLIHDTAD